MGKWSLDGIRTRSAERNGGTFGTFMFVTFRLKYTKHAFSKFTEMPTLEWKERITLLDRGAGTFWEFTGDQYARCPGSTTFSPWVGRYKLGYFSARERRAFTITPTSGSVLLDTAGRVVPRDHLPKVTDPEQAADAARAYLREHGGHIEVTIMDSPGVIVPDAGDGTLKERVLTFDCGLRGMGRRVYAWQHLIVDAAQPAGRWTRKFEFNARPPGVKTTGLRRIGVPPGVSIMKPKTAAGRSGDYT